MNKNQVFIFEFICGGGFNKTSIPTSLLCEGFGMLRSIISDFKSLNFSITTILDSRIFFLSPLLKVDEVIQVGAKDNHLKLFEKYVNKANYIFIIAPEFSNILYNLTKIAKNSNKTILSVNLEGIKLGTSKFKTYMFFKNCNINTPKTYLIPFKNGEIDPKFILHKLKELKQPIIIKPVDGVGAESILYFENSNELNEFLLSRNQYIDPERYYILQEYIKGDDLSASLIGTGLNLNYKVKSPIILSINTQFLLLGSFNRKSEYFGGSTPAESYQEIYENLKVIINHSDFSKIKGYYGIDFIRKENKLIYLLEINPRLTTSYIGLRNTINFNPVELMLNSNTKESIIDEVKYVSHSMFSRIELQYKGNLPIEEIQEICMSSLLEKIPELVTPPISLDKSPNFSCFIATNTKDFLSSKNRVNEIIEILNEFDFTTVISILIK